MEQKNVINTPHHSIEEWDTIVELLSLNFSKMRGYNISKQDIHESLFITFTDSHRIDWPGNLIDANIGYDEAMKQLSDFDFQILKQIISIEDEIIPKDVSMGYKARFKVKGMVFCIHKYDKDPFPSSPHAHQLDNNIKVNLSNGMCYKVKKHIHTLTKKDLIIMRTKASEVYAGDLPALAI